MGHLEHEGLVDLDLVHRKLLEVGQRGVARAEVVDGERDAHRSELLEHRAGALRVTHDHRLGDLQTEAARGHVELLEQDRDVIDEAAVQEGARGEVDGDGEVEPALAPLARLADRRAQYVMGHRRHEPGVLGDRHELVGHDQAAGRVHPARQGLDAQQRARRDVDLRLEVQDQLFVLDRATQLAGESEALDGVAVLL